MTTKVPGNKNEKRGFQYFVAKTAPELTGFYTTGFWEDLILQASAGEPSLRHSVIAIGALHESFSQKQLEKAQGTERETMTFAMGQYAKALRHLRKSLATGKQKPLVAVISCVLFVCFDCLRGFFESAMIHLQSGLKILRDMSRTKETDHIIETIVSPLLLRLCVQSIMYVDTRSVPERKLFASELTYVCQKGGEVPETFETLEEARTSVMEAANGLFNMFYMYEPNKPCVDQDPRIHVLYEKYSAQLAAWNVAYERFMNAKSHTFTSKQIRGAALLKIHHITATVMAAGNPSLDDSRAVAQALNCPRQMQRFTVEFQTIVRLCRSLITTAEQDARNGKAPLTFSADLGVIGPLYYVGVKCRIPSIRADIVDLLKRCPRKEGMWDSVASLQLMRDFWELEEAHEAVLQASPGKEIPMHQLVNLVYHDGQHWEWQWKEVDSEWSEVGVKTNTMNASKDMLRGFWDLKYKPSKSDLAVRNRADAAWASVRVPTLKPGEDLEAFGPVSWGNMAVHE